VRNQSGEDELIDHLSIGVRNLDRAIAFYDAVLAPLGLRRLETLESEGAAHPHRSASYGRDGEPLTFWLEERPKSAPAGPGFHIAFAAPDRASVQAFHAAGLAHGARDNGAPGLREQYAPGYYAAFLFDPEGWLIEAVTFSPT